MAPKKTTSPSEIPSEVPMFLRKTYHMIDSCDPTVACWSEDGETFVVKDPSKFESVIIPQFFKHSKFTSFVRQLNFYSFRKIKYVDTIRLDPKLEAETANFWRFRHENFQRGKPHLLTEIKRMTASQNRAAAEKAANASSASSGASSPSSTQMKQEIDTLKQRLEEMNKNMSELTSMVQKVSLKDDNQDATPVGNKRKKVEFMPEPVHSTSMSDALPEATLDLFLEDEDAPSSSLFPSDSIEMDVMSEALGMPIPDATMSRTTSTASNMTDTDFVDQLFDAFGSDGEEEAAFVEPAQVTSTPLPPLQSGNRPDPELMDRLGEALGLLPKDMQEQIVDRLIASITSNALVGAKPAADVVPLPPKKDDEDDAAMTQTPEEEGIMGMPLAAATLASLLSYYSALVKDNHPATDNKPAVKPIPVIPCHA